MTRYQPRPLPSKPAVTRRANPTRSRRGSDPSYGTRLADAAFHARNAARALGHAQAKAPPAHKRTLDQLIARLDAVVVVARELAGPAFPRAPREAPGPDEARGGDTP